MFPSREGFAELSVNGSLARFDEDCCFHGRLPGEYTGDTRSYYGPINLRWSGTFPAREGSDSKSLFNGWAAGDFCNAGKLSLEAGKRIGRLVS
jgi:hypothetical protein